MTVRSTEPPGWLNGGRIPSLDGVRAIAVLLVIFNHAHQSCGFPNFRFLHVIGSYTDIGVDVFFVLSGFLITLLLLRERRVTGRVSISGFYLRRVLRILPAYSCMLSLTAVLCLLGYSHLSRRDWIAATTYSVNFVYRPAWDIGHVWSLSIEEHFYLIWPFLMALSAPLARRAAVGCLAFCFVARWVVMIALPAYLPMAELWTFTRMDTIACGCVLAFLAVDDRWRQRLDAIVFSQYLLVVTIFALLGTLALSYLSPARFQVGFRFSLAAACIAVLIWAAVRRADTWLGRVLNHWTFQSIGIISYSLYLWQQIFLFRGKTGFIHTFPQNVALAFLTAYASYHLIEKPFLALKKAKAAAPAVRPALAIPAGEELTGTLVTA